jgi:hypothetical protein
MNLSKELEKMDSDSFAIIKDDYDVLDLIELIGENHILKDFDDNDKDVFAFINNGVYYSLVMKFSAEGDSGLAAIVARDSEVLVFAIQETFPKQIIDSINSSKRVK